ncbi:MAG: HAD family hydrolase [Thermomicrobiaceae bacterium]
MPISARHPGVTGQSHGISAQIVGTADCEVRQLLSAFRLIPGKKRYTGHDELDIESEVNHLMDQHSGSRSKPGLVLFDLDDTLCDHEGSLRVRLRASFAAAFNGSPPDYIERIVEESIERSVFGTDHFAEILEPHGVTAPERLKAAEDVYVGDRFRGLQLYPEARDVVEYVRKQTRIGMITNGPSDIQRQKIELLEIGDLFPFILVSEEVEMWKPDPRIFQRAMELGQAEPAETVYIGDNPGHDIAGAKASGVTSIWVNRSEREWPGDERPDFEINNLRQIVSILSLE